MFEIYRFGHDIMFEIVGDTDPKAGEVFKSNYDSDAFFKAFVDKQGIIRIVKWKDGLLYSTPGNVLGIILSKEFDTSDWKTSLFWSRNKEGDVLCVYNKKTDGKFWCIQNNYLSYISKITGKKELTVRYNQNNDNEQLALVEYNRWTFVIAPSYMDEKDLKHWNLHWNTIDFKEMSFVSLDDLW